MSDRVPPLPVLPPHLFIGNIFRQSELYFEQLVTEVTVVMGRIQILEARVRQEVVHSSVHGPTMSISELRNVFRRLNVLYFRRQRLQQDLGALFLSWLEMAARMRRNPVLE